MQNSKPKIIERMLPINPFSRPGRKLVSVKGIVVHWVAWPGASGQRIYEYFKSLADQNKDAPGTRYASTHFTVGLEGEILRHLPDDEIAYHVGAHKYVDGILERFNTTWPNNCLLGIEMCHHDKSGKFNEKTLRSTIELISYLIRKYDLTTDDIVRHYDVTGKICPKYFVEREDEFVKFVQDVDRYLKNNK